MFREGRKLSSNHHPAQEEASTHGEGSAGSRDAKLTNRVLVFKAPSLTGSRTDSSEQEQLRPPPPPTVQQPMNTAQKSFLLSNPGQGTRTKAEQGSR